MRAHLHKTRLLKKKPTWTANVKRLKRFSVCFVYMQKKNQNLQHDTIRETTKLLPREYGYCP